MLFLVWMTNAYNFMDGIDGLAAVQAVTVGAGGALVHSLAVAAPSWQLPLLAAAASLGFLAWNFPRARIFMGDVGSGFLGLLFALVALQAAMVQSALFWAWLVLLGVFVVDATATLLRRVLAGERIFEAHRTHAYQRAARRLGSHVPVTLAVAVINTVWLLPIACLVALERVQAIAGLGVAYLPLLLAWLWSWRRWA
jgi:Fuc2NAc and GlcNAc transferase